MSSRSAKTYEALAIGTESTVIAEVARDPRRNQEIGTSRQVNGFTTLVRHGLPGRGPQVPRRVLRGVAHTARSASHHGGAHLLLGAERRLRRERTPSLAQSQDYRSIYLELHVQPHPAPQTAGSWPGCFRKTQLPARRRRSNTRRHRPGAAAGCVSCKGRFLASSVPFHSPFSPRPFQSP